METLIMHPKNKEQLSALKAFAKAMKVDFETDTGLCNMDHTPNSETIKAIEEARIGKIQKISDIDAFLKSV